MPYLDRQATIAEAKLTKYLLIQKPTDDKSGFLAQAGYNLDNWWQLQQELQQIGIGHVMYANHKNLA
jgi:hypothetical protein